jgi:Protein of unknown function (DUF2804)
MSDLVNPGAAAPHVAMWEHPLVDPNLEDAQCAHALSRLAGVPGARAVEAAYRRRLRHKTWQYMTAVSGDLFIAFVVGTAGFAGNGFVYVVERGGQIHKRFAITPLGVGVDLSRSSTRGTHLFGARGLEIVIDNLDGGRRFEARIAARLDDGSRIAAELSFTSAPTDEHFSLCVPLPEGRWNYTHKFGAFAVTGYVQLGERRIELSSAHGTLDFTKMYALRHAVWRWVALCGRSTRGALVGVNLVDPTPPASFSENCVWIDGKREPLSGVVLAVDPPGDIASGWRLRASGLDLTMRAVGHVEQRLDVPLVRHRLRHVVGAFSGRVQTATGEHELVDLLGIAEDNDTWW